MSGFDRVLLTPNSATEASNLIVYGVDDPLRSQFMATLGLILRNSDEHYKCGAEISKHPEFMRLGLTDAAWLTILDDQSVFLTDDVALYLAALNIGVKAYNFAHVRAWSTFT